MKYRSTRNPEELVTASEAITRGISADGGLFVPESLPKYTYADLTAMQLMSYQERAAFILKDFLTDFTREEIEECVASCLYRRKVRRRDAGAVDACPGWGRQPVLFGIVARTDLCV